MLCVRNRKTETPAVLENVSYNYLSLLSRFIIFQNWTRRTFPRHPVGKRTRSTLVNSYISNLNTKFDREKMPRHGRTNERKEFKANNFRLYRRPTVSNFPLLKSGPTKQIKKPLIQMHSSLITGSKLYRHCWSYTGWWSSLDPRSYSTTLTAAPSLNLQQIVHVKDEKKVNVCCTRLPEGRKCGNAADGNCNRFAPPPSFTNSGKEI